MAAAERFAQAGPDGFGLAAVGPEREDRELRRQTRGQLLQDRERAIAAAVVDEEEVRVRHLPAIRLEEIRAQP